MPPLSTFEDSNRTRARPKSPDRVSQCYARGSDTLLIYAVISYCPERKKSKIPKTKNASVAIVPGRRQRRTDADVSVGCAHIIYPDKRAKRCVTEVISARRKTSFKRAGFAARVFYNIYIYIYNLYTRNIHIYIHVSTYTHTNKRAPVSRKNEKKKKRRKTYVYKEPPRVRFAKGEKEQKDRLRESQRMRVYGAQQQ